MSRVIRRFAAFIGAQCLCFSEDSQTRGKLARFLDEHLQYGEYKPIVFHPPREGDRLNKIVDGKTYIGYLESCKGYMDIFNVEQCDDIREDVFNNGGWGIGCRGAFDDDPDDERCAVSFIAAEMDVPTKVTDIYQMGGNWTLSPCFSEASSDGLEIDWSGDDEDMEQQLSTVKGPVRLVDYEMTDESDDD